VTALKRHSARFPAATWRRIERVAERLDVSLACVVRALMDHGLDDAEEPLPGAPGARVLDAQILGATVKVGAPPKRRYREDPTIAGVVDDLRLFESLAGEATSRDWAQMSERARDLVRYFDRRAGEQRSAEADEAERVSSRGAA
jgi:hypothetical protein